MDIVYSALDFDFEEIRNHCFPEELPQNIMGYASLPKHRRGKEDRDEEASDFREKSAEDI